MEGRVFGLLTVLHEAETSKPGKYYLCRCECGNQKEVRGTALRSGHTKSCGCQRSIGAGEKKKDLSGQKFGMLTVIQPIKVKVDGKNKGQRWRCRCDCGNYVTVRGGLLVSGNNKSCGCAGNLPRPKDITGQKFGRLTALERTVAKLDTAYLWLCRCDCGEYVSVAITNLTAGHTRSCGCLRKTATMSAYQHVARRRLRKKQAIAPWFSEWDQFVEDEAHILIAQRELETGIPWNVDHMIPITATKICGLHCGDNLQVIPAALNCAKRNRLVFTERNEWLKA